MKKLVCEQTMKDWIQNYNEYKDKEERSRLDINLIIIIIAVAFHLSMSVFFYNDLVSSIKVDEKKEGAILMITIFLPITIFFFLGISTIINHKIRPHIYYSTKICSSAYAGGIELFNLDDPIEKEVLAKNKNFILTGLEEQGFVKGVYILRIINEIRRAKKQLEKERELNSFKESNPAVNKSIESLQKLKSESDSVKD